jgi:simple sugar transport system ATP-binding protein
MPARLSVAGLTKRFGAVTANDRVSFEVEAGELHCLLGENGAGKSTLVGCLSGRLQPDEGQILYDGKQIHLANPAEAARLGIAVVQQHFVLIPRFTVFENVTIGTRLPGLSETQAKARLSALAASLGIDLDIDAAVETLSVGQQQWVEILKALYLEARLVLLDEPTAVLTPPEAGRLFEMIGQMTGRGIAVVMISHKFDEVMRADRVTVLRRGKTIGTVSTAETTREDLARMMVGRDFAFVTDRRKREVTGAPMLEVEDLALPGAPPLSFTVRAGEILGIAGVAGNGQDALFQVLSGCGTATGGTIRIDGKVVGQASPQRVARQGVGSVPSDRYRDGLVADFTVADNMILGRQHEAPVSAHGFLQRRVIRDFALKCVEDFGIVPASITAPASRLSGGNAQKLILAREFQRARHLLVCNQPTRGLDIGVIEYVRSQITARRDEGCAVLLASEELDELFVLADRILVLCRGEIMGILETADTSRQQIGLMMAGQRLQ